MRMPIRRALAAALAGVLVLAAATASPASETTAALGLASVFGAGAAARLDPAAALFANPAAAARLDGAAVWSGIGVRRGVDVARAAVSMPLLSGPTFAVGYGGFGAAPPARRDVVYLGAAQLLPGAVALGFALELQSNSEAGDLERSFGIDAGTHWRTAGGALPGRFDAALVLAHIDQESRSLCAAAAWSGALGPAWGAGATAGLESDADTRRRLAFGTFLRRGATELAAGVHDGALRLGGAAQAGAWRFAYTYSDDDGTHGLGVEWHFGPSREERQLARTQALELEIAGRVHALAGEVEASRLATWQRAGARALAEGRHTQAVGWFGAVLAVRPETASAQGGLQQAHHAAWVSRADSLLGARDTDGAAHALEQALRVMPADTTSAQRLEALRNAVHSADQARDTTSHLFDEAVQAFAQQRHQDAVRGFDAVLRLDPKHPTASSYRKLAQSAHELSLGSALRTARQRLDSGDLEAARAQVRRVLEAEPRHEEALKLLARIEKRAKPVVSHPSAEDAAPAVPAFVAERYQEGLQRFRSDDFVSAMHAWEEVSRVAPHYEEVDRYLLHVYRVTGIESYTEGHLRQAVDSFEKGLRLEPGNVQLRRYLNQAQAKLARTQATDAPER